MPLITLSAVSGPDGHLKLDIPTGAAVTEFEVTVSPKATVEDEVIRTPEGRGWPPGYFETYAGCITDETFVAPPRSMPRPVPPLDAE